MGLTAASARMHPIWQCVLGHAFVRQLIPWTEKSERRVALTLLAAGIEPNPTLSRMRQGPVAPAAMKASKLPTHVLSRFVNAVQPMAPSWNFLHHWSCQG